MRIQSKHEIHHVQFAFTASQIYKYHPLGCKTTEAACSPKIKFSCNERNGTERSFQELNIKLSLKGMPGAADLNARRKKKNINLRL